LEFRAGQVRFRATQGLEVLPISAQFFTKRPIAQASDEDTLYRQLYADLLGEEGLPAFYETTPLPAPSADGTLPILDLIDPQVTVDGCLWMALLTRSPQESVDEARAAIAHKTLTLGVMPYLEGEGITAGFDRQPDQSSPLRWEIADATASANNPRYRPLDSRAFGSILTEPSLVELQLGSIAQLQMWDFNEPGLEGTGDNPPSLADTNLRNRVIAWIRLRIDKSVNNSSLKAKIGWIAINATQVQQRIEIVNESVGTGTGEPDQCFRLAQTPVLPESLVLTVGGEAWQRIDDLWAAPPEVPVADPRQPTYRALTASQPTSSLVYTLDPESGAICFGDGAKGSRPTQLIVASYASGGGQQGNVGIGAIARSPQLPAGYKVTNPIRTWGGDNAQDLTQAEKGVAQYVRHRDRLVSVQDFEDITHRTPGVDLGRVEVLPLFDPTQSTETQIPGAITVLVIPASPLNDNPQPDSFFLTAVCRHLQPRRLVTTELYIRAPQYVDVWVSVAIAVLGGFATAPVQEAVKRELYRFLSPLYGGQSGTGWTLNVPIRQQELVAVVARVAGVQLVSELLVGTATGETNLSGLKLPRLAGVSVTGEPAIPVDQLRNSPSAVPATGDRWTPIPVLPAQC
jgi:hypothetical protein